MLCYFDSFFHSIFQFRLKADVVQFKQWTRSENNLKIVLSFLPFISAAVLLYLVSFSVLFSSFIFWINSQLICVMHIAYAHNNQNNVEECSSFCYTYFIISFSMCLFTRLHSLYFAFVIRIMWKINKCEKNANQKRDMKFQYQLTHTRQMLYICIWLRHLLT